LSLLGASSRSRWAGSTRSHAPCNLASQRGFRAAGRYLYKEAERLAAVVDSLTAAR
jgi:hypothetical protein